MKTLQQNKNEKLLPLLDDVKENSPGAMDSFVTEIQQTIFAFGMKVCGGEIEDAKDNMQDVLLQFLRGIDKLDFNNSSALLVWLYKVSKNACMMSRRKKKGQPEYNISIDSISDDKSELNFTINTKEYTIKNPEFYVIEKETNNIVQEMLLKVPIELRLVLILRDLEGLTTKETSEILGITEENVRVRLHRARLISKKLLNSENK